MQFVSLLMTLAVFLLTSQMTLANGQYLGKSEKGDACSYMYLVDDYENLPTSVFLTSEMNAPYLKFEVLMGESLFLDIFSTGKAFAKDYKLPDPFIEGPTFLYLETLGSGQMLVQFRREEEHSSRGKKFLEVWKMVLDQNLKPLRIDMEYSIGTRSWGDRWRWGTPFINNCVFSR